MEIQKWLKNNNGNFELLEVQLGIGSKFHPTLPYVKLNYSQIDSPKMHPIVQECRGLVLHKDTFELVGGCFRRFFNLGEADEITKHFDWNNFDAFEKMDGSWISVFWCTISNNWIVTTRGSWADSEILPDCPRWDDLVKKLLQDKLDSMIKGLTYIFELCSPYNKVVRNYPEPKLVLLGVIETPRNHDVSAPRVQVLAGQLYVETPNRYNFHSQEDIIDFLREKESSDPTFEGVVIRDVNGLRLKVKSATYVALHHLKGNGNLFLTKNLLPFILAKETDEVLLHFPEASSRVIELTDLIDRMYKQLSEVWWHCQDYKEQKAFALYITKTNPTPFSCILFNMKREDCLSDERELVKRFRESNELILKILKD